MLTRANRGVVAHIGLSGSVGGTATGRRGQTRAG